ncbi:UDP-N-acetylglucosamine 2-epimerase (non-hydrolyzing) [Paenibacillus sp. IB182496]|uniref:UDP-N-acetylglucosamine 2-epimerase (Non-hydrolyzing) n=1 Tax=Paenibacillus sabuli TaxID=2772509 RepID=A0A927GT72_9BACL|nr:UDP-N-acetylglucosamine 2-epimerase (non-hydrolyzing) [Paenibacillus sabuli]MBD2846422.1 UDP-N-acetylglucosamine 2-epimerase (non-hydrolyzing) [Paenibacillus sabuli]
MNVLTILGTRPEIIRLSLIIRKLDQLAHRHVLVHTGQNFTTTLSRIFFDELGVRLPDYSAKGREQTLGKQLAAMMRHIEPILERERPDKVLVLGDTNSALSAVLAERMGIPVVHMEAGNRCFDLAVPEEKNRRVIDAISSINMPYTRQSKENLLREGVPVHRIVVSGNPIYEVLEHFKPAIAASPILRRLRLQPKDYLLVTIHRAENVDRPAHLREILEGLNLTAARFGLRLICSTHPRTRSKLAAMGIEMHPLVEFHEPFGFFDFVKLEGEARCVLTDSGTVQEECCLLRVPTVTVRHTTERPETVDCGSNIVTGVAARRIADGVALMTATAADWSWPEGYAVPDVSDRVVRYLLGGNAHV